MIKCKTINREDSGVRTCEIKYASDKSFLTPTRALSFSERSAEDKTSLQTSGEPFSEDLSFTNQVIEIGEQVNNSKLIRFAEQNGAFKTTKKKINSMIDAFEGIHIYYPHIIKYYGEDIKDPNGQIVRNKNGKKKTRRVKLALTRKDIERVIDLQKQTNLHYTTIPPLLYTKNPSDFIKELEYFYNCSQKRFNKETFLIPYLDPEMGGAKRGVKDFKEILDYLFDCGSAKFPIIGLSLHGKDIHGFNPSLRHIQERQQEIINKRKNLKQVKESEIEDIWFHASGLDRIASDGTSNPHILQWYGIDSVALKPKKAPSKLHFMVKDKTEKGITLTGGLGEYQESLKRDYAGITEIKREINRYDHSTLGTTAYTDFEVNHSTEGTLNCKCPVCKNKSLLDFIKDRGAEKNNQFSKYQLNRYEKIHEIYSSLNEFENGQKYITSNESAEYIESKKYLSKNLTKANSP